MIECFKHADGFFRVTRFGTIQRDVKATPQVQRRPAFQKKTTQAMLPASDSITITLPRPMLADIAGLSSELTDRMHAWLERNTDGTLNEIERSELQVLVRSAEFGQIVAMALQTPSLS